MSGGSYDYVSHRLNDAAGTLRRRHPTRAHVLALATHLDTLAAVMHAIEWADSGDTSWDDPTDIDAAIRAALTPGAELAAAREMAEQALRALHEALGHKEG